MERHRCVVRPMRSDDESMLLLLAEESLQPLATGAGHTERFHPDELLDLLGRATVFVAEAEREIAGYVAVERSGDALAVRCLCIGPAYEATPVCHQLVDWVEGLGFDQRVRRLAAPIPADDGPSRRLYGEHGFVPRPAADRPETIVMEKRLPEG